MEGFVTQPMEMGYEQPMGRSWSVAGVVICEQPKRRGRKGTALYQKDAFWNADSGLRHHSMRISMDLRRMAVHQRVRRIRKRPFIRCLIIFVAEKKYRKMRSRILNLCWA